MESVSHVALVMKANGDLLVYSRSPGRPTKEETTKINCPASLRKELAKMKREMNFNNGTDILLALSIATDEMARHVHMFPEVFYMDVTHGTNRQKRELFLMVVKDASGEAFPGNATVVPCGKRWVFQKIYQSFFIHLYGVDTISRNRLALTDDDLSAHGPFDNCIKTMQCYRRSTHMLCVFHALVMAFYEQIYPKLPHQGTGKKKKLTKRGGVYGTIVNIYVTSTMQYAHLTVITLYQSLLLGMILYLWFMSQCTDVETKFEYDRSQKELLKFLKMKTTRKVLGKKCIHAVKELQKNLQTKEAKLANYIRMGMKNCMDACTTSPVESNNNAIKHGAFKVTSNMNIDKVTKNLMNHINSRLRKRRHKAIRQVNQVSKASRAHTKNHVIPKGQGLIDRNYDAREHGKSAQVGPNKYIVFDFDRHDYAEITDTIQVYLPKFMRVRELSVDTSASGTNFVNCSCQGRKRYGVPCRCYFRIADNGLVNEEEIIDLSMIDARYLKLFNAHYGDGGKLGECLYEAQTQCFKNEHNGIQVSNNLAMKLKGSMNAEYPILGKNTNQKEFNEAMHVLSLDCCDQFDLERYRLFEEDDEDDDETLLRDLTNNDSSEDDDEEQVVLSRLSAAMQAGISKSNETSNMDVIGNDKNLHDRQKNMRLQVDTVLMDQMGSLSLKNDFESDVDEAYKRYIQAVNDEWGQNGGGEGAMELYGKTQAIAKPKERMKRAF